MGASDQTLAEASDQTLVVASDQTLAVASDQTLVAASSNRTVAAGDQAPATAAVGLASSLRMAGQWVILAHATLGLHSSHHTQTKPPCQSSPLSPCMLVASTKTLWRVIWSTSLQREQDLRFVFEPRTSFLLILLADGWLCFE